MDAGGLNGDLGDSIASQDAAEVVAYGILHAAADETEKHCKKPNHTETSRKTCKLQRFGLLYLGPCSRMPIGLEQEMQQNSLPVLWPSR